MADNKSKYSSTGSLGKDHECGVRQRKSHGLLYDYVPPLHDII